MLNTALAGKSVAEAAMILKFNQHIFTPFHNTGGHTNKYNLCSPYVYCLILKWGQYFDMMGIAELPYQLISTLATREDTKKKVSNKC